MRCSSCRRSRPDTGDAGSVQSHLEFDAHGTVNGLKVGYFPGWMKENPATDVDRAALDHVRSLGMVPTEVKLPDWPYGSLMPVLFSEAAASFEDLTLSGGMSKLKAQVPDAWPNLFRQARFLSGVDLSRRTVSAASSRWRWRACSRAST